MTKFKVLTDRLNTFFTNNKITTGNSIPTSGEWNVGDICISSIQENGECGWICTESGTPGKWEIFGSGGSGKLVSLTSSVEVTGPVTEVSLTGLGTNVSENDKLFVHYNSTHLLEGVDFEIISNGTKIRKLGGGSWNESSSNAMFAFELLKHVKKVNGDNILLDSKMCVLKSNKTISAPASEVEIGIEGFNKDSDYLTVYVNSTYLTEGVDYNISSDSGKIVSLNGNWNEESLSDYRFSFVVIKEVGIVNPEAVVGTENLKDGSITMGKLGEDVINKINKISESYVYVEDFGAKGDGTTDDTYAFQKAVDYASNNSKTICLLNKTYSLTGFTFKNNVSILSNEYAILNVLTSNKESFIKMDSGPITNLTYSACLKNIFINCNPNNISQKIIDVTAMKSISGTGGGLWHFTFENVRIQTVSNNQIGIYSEANDTIQGVDVANQYINFKNVNIYKNSENSYCIKFIGQIGQTKFDGCEINGVDSIVKGWLIEFEPLQSNDNAFMPITFDNCTFQNCDKGIYAKNAHVIFNNCHVEGIINQFAQAKGGLAHIEFNNSNVSGGVKPFRIEGRGTITGKGNTWTSPNGVACALEGEATGNYLFDLDLYMSDMYLCHESPYYNHSAITLNVGYSKNVILTTQITDIQIIKGMFKTGDVLTITNMNDSVCNIENNNFTPNSNLYWAGNSVITLEKYHSVKFISNGTNFILLDVQRNVNNDVVIKTKDVTITFTSGILTAEVNTDISFDKIIGVFLVHSDNVYHTEPVIGVKSNGKLWAKARSNPSQSYDITVRVKYLE